jgi:transcriptional regulator with XRE-family HTH domain
MAETQTVVRTLEEWRKEKGYESREILAVQTRGRVSASTIGRIERGEVYPERRTREDIAEALGVPMTAILWPAANR